ncbi:MAG: hypothetical protein J6R37_01130 [Clostridia bacterium]|nr:hypothetical protein [Clostridia bacterium]
MTCDNCKEQQKGFRSYVCKKCRKRYCDLCASVLGFTCPNCLEELLYTS